MKNLSNITQILPITLVGFYITLYAFIDSDIYYDLYNKLVIKIDTALLVATFTASIFHIRRWKPLAVLSTITVILLNILTELNFRFNIEYYYDIYYWVIICFFLIMIAFSSTTDNKDYGGIMG